MIKQKSEKLEVKESRITNHFYLTTKPARLITTLTSLITAFGVLHRMLTAYAHATYVFHVFLKIPNSCL